MRIILKATMDLKMTKVILIISMKQGRDSWVTGLIGPLKIYGSSFLER
jgi:hypothetical protein